MSANAYCSNDSTKYVETFVELCPAAQFRIIIQLLYVPVIVVGSILIMATIYLLKKLHTPHDFVLFAIAVVDLIIGVVTCPLYLLKVFPETADIVGDNRWACILISGVRVIIARVAFDLLTLMCIDRFLMIWKPIWYRNRVTKRVIIITILSVLVFRVIELLVFICLNFIYQQDMEWSPASCKKYIFGPTLFATVGDVLFYVEIVLSCGLCIKAIIIALRRHNNRAEDYGEYKRVKFNVILMSSLMFLFLILWLPTAIQIISHYTSYTINTPILNDLSRAIRFINSGLNAFVYAVTRPVYRTSFKCLLTTPPWEWREKSKSQLRQDMVAKLLPSKCHLTTTNGHLTVSSLAAGGQMHRQSQARAQASPSETNRDQASLAETDLPEIWSPVICGLASGLKSA